MRRIILSKAIPHTTSLLLTIFVGSYIYFSLTSEQSNPSSTSAVGYLFLPIYAILAGILGYFIGLIPKSILEESKEEYSLNLFTYLLILIFLIIMTIYYSSNISHENTKIYIEQNKPKVLSNFGNLEKIKIDKTSNILIASYGKLIWTFSKNSISAILIDNKKHFVHVKNHTFMELKINKQTSIVYDVHKYSYLTKIYSLQYHDNHSKNLVLLLRLRATSFKYIVLVYNQKYELIYEELLESNNRNPYIGIQKNGKLIIDLGTPYELTGYTSPEV